MRTIKEINEERLALARQQQKILKSHGIDVSRSLRPEDKRKIKRNKNMEPVREINEKLTKLSREIDLVKMG